LEIKAVRKLDDILSLGKYGAMFQKGNEEDGIFLGGIRHFTFKKARDEKTALFAR